MSVLLKFIKRSLQVMLIGLVICILFRGWLYRHLVTYRSIGQRTPYFVTNNKLAAYIDKSTENKKSQDIKEIIEMSLSATSKQLNYTATKNDIDPNKLISSQTAHCVGYAFFFSTTCNYLIDKNDRTSPWIAIPQIGQLSLLGINIHKYINTPFFKDHDFVIIKNKATGKTYAVDPTVNDYLFIDFVTYKK